MRRFFIVWMVVSVLAGLAAVEAAAGKRSSGQRFWGVWAGIDPADGSSQQLLISGGADGAFNLLWRESYWTVCDGRRAVLEGIGELDSYDRNTLVIQMVITCFAPEEVPVTDTITFRLVGQNMLLATAEGAFTDLPFFRISSRVRGGGDDADR